MLARNHIKQSEDRMRTSLAGAVLDVSQENLLKSLPCVRTVEWQSALLALL
jgi:hypothetical protein